MTRKWYATLRHSKMHPHTKFEIPTSKNIGDMDRTRKRDGRTDGRTDSAITICLPKFLWGHKKYEFRRTLRKCQKVLISKGGCCRHVSLKIETSMNDLTCHMNVWFKHIYFILMCFQSLSDPRFSFFKQL